MSQTIERTSAPPFKSRLREGVAAHAVFFVIALGGLIALQLAKLFVPRLAESSMAELAVGIFTFSIPIAVVVLALYIFGTMVLTDRPDKPMKILWQRLKAVLKDPEAMAAGLPLFASLILFMFAFTAFKAAIPLIQPYGWDATFDAWDKTLHFGLRPVDLLQPVLGYPPITFLLNLNYNIWFITMNLFWVHYAFMTRPGVERTRFFLAFMLITATVGTLFAILFSSAGPCYFGRLGLLLDPYAGHMAYLDQVYQSWPIWALDTQDMLWRYQAEGSVFGGISAFPSVHNATALLFVLAVWNKGKIIRRLMIAHALLIFLGSIHLGWHYAVDGYAAWVLTLPCWWAAGQLATWWESRPHVSAFAAKLS